MLFFKLRLSLIIYYCLHVDVSFDELALIINLFYLIKSDNNSKKTAKFSDYQSKSNVDEFISVTLCITAAGWWFDNCYYVNLNGEYFPGGITNGALGGIQWRGWGGLRNDGVYTSTEMRITRG